jgi:hypothetical protein
MRQMKARFDDVCRGCGTPIKVDSLIRYGGPGQVFHDGCQPSGHPHLDAEYYKGRQDVENHRWNKMIYGEEEAERMEIEDDLRSGEGW